MESSSFSFRENQSIEDPPPVLPVLPVFDPQQLEPIPDSVPTDVKILLQKFPSILRTGDVKPTPTHVVEHHIHTASHPPVFAKSRRLDPEKLEIASFLNASFLPVAHRNPLCMLKRPFKSFELIRFISSLAFCN